MEVSRLWKVSRTVHEMVSDRGFMVAAHELQMSLDDFSQAYAPSGSIDRAALTFLVQHHHDDAQLLVFFADDETVGIKPIRKICERMMSQVSLG